MSNSWGEQGGGDQNCSAIGVSAAANCAPAANAAVMWSARAEIAGVGS
ncbi:hypothetical protein [Streptomyces silvisoli]|uniref:Uncharacterized protein n=1 Tax=Streptomyces silvisoli TaxID=3034235 RepID=A0ABT5ZP41_9ACTN|nr:hypothetical protein [Streptomyces silvisoli]MDF3291583.1 hypothetical protein [Streptomyces silvisoli]